MKPCKNCGFMPKDCTCKGTEKKETSAPCQLCGVIHKRIYLKNTSPGVECCTSCFIIEQLPAEDKAFFQQMSDESGLPVQDMPLHMLVANKKNIPLGAYLQTLPRNAEQYKAYFKGKDINIGGRKL